MRGKDRFMGRITGEQPSPGARDNLAVRLVYMVMIWAMISVAGTVLTVATVVQYVLMVMHRGEPNPRLAEFGEALGIWLAKAARYQTGASEVKPWPWTELD
jgi:cobalamin biosynthesis protein CobD/CbiB